MVTRGQAEAQQAGHLPWPWAGVQRSRCGAVSPWPRSIMSRSHKRKSQRLQELRAGVIENRIQADLTLDRHGHVVSDAGVQRRRYAAGRWRMSSTITTCLVQRRPAR
jgi:hypothetical protein